MSSAALYQDSSLPLCLLLAYSGWSQKHSMKMLYRASSRSIQGQPFESLSAYC